MVALDVLLGHDQGGPEQEFAVCRTSTRRGGLPEAAGCRYPPDRSAAQNRAGMALDDMNLLCVRPAMDPNPMIVASRRHPPSGTRMRSRTRWHRSRVTIRENAMPVTVGTPILRRRRGPEPQLVGSADVGLDAGRSRSPESARSCSRTSGPAHHRPSTTMRSRVRRPTTAVEAASVGPDSATAGCWLSM